MTINFSEKGHYMKDTFDTLTYPDNSKTKWCDDCVMYHSDGETDAKALARIDWYGACGRFFGRAKTP